MNIKPTNLGPSKLLSHNHNVLGKTLTENVGLKKTICLKNKQNLRNADLYRTEPARTELFNRPSIENTGLKNLQLLSNTVNTKNSIGRVNLSYKYLLGSKLGDFFV